MTKKEKAMELLVERKLSLTEGELAQRLNTTGSTVRSIVSSIRRDGFAIYKNEGRINSKGQKTPSRYRFGSPTRAMVAAFYQTFGAAA